MRQYLGVLDDMNGVCLERGGLPPTCVISIEQKVGRPVSVDVNEALLSEFSRTIYMVDMALPEGYSDEKNVPSNSTMTNMWTHFFGIDAMNKTVYRDGIINMLNGECEVDMTWGNVELPLPTNDRSLSTQCSSTPSIAAERKRYYHDINVEKILFPEYFITLMANE